MKAIGNEVGVAGSDFGSFFCRVSVPVQYKDHEIQLPGRFDKPADLGPFPAVILLHGCGGYQEHPPHSTVVEHASWRRVCVLDRRRRPPLVVAALAFQASTLSLC